MRKYSSKDFVWKELKLYYNEELLSEVIPYKSEYTKDKKLLYQIKWPNGELSDHYNLTHAKDNSIKFWIAAYNKMEELEQNAHQTPANGVYSGL